MLINEKITINNKEQSFSYIKNPKNENVVIFLNGINGEVDIITTYNHEVFKKNYIVTFNNIAHGDNCLKHTSNPKKYVEYAKDMILELKKNKKFANKKFILIGESFGSNIVSMMAFKYPDIVDLFFCWNAPTKISKAKLPIKMLIPVSLKTIVSMILNIETYSPYYFGDNLTSNKAILRIRKMKPVTMTSNKLNLAVWKSMKKVASLLIKDKLPKNFYYNQSLEDIMMTDSILKIKPQARDNYYFYDKGRHILSFENEAGLMFERLNTLIKQLH
ncbi:MAG: hypothetical protein ACRC4M_01945 [Mycoplasma sp.]